MGGRFTRIGGVARTALAAIDATTGLATDWNAELAFHEFPSVLAVSDGIVYLGGGFTTIHGQPRYGLAAFTTGTITQPLAERHSSTASRLIVTGSSLTSGRLAFRYWVPASGHARLKLFDVRGRHVATLLDQDVPEGWGEASWDGAGHPLRPGVYFAELEAAGERRMGKHVLMH